MKSRTVSLFVLGTLLALLLAACSSASPASQPPAPSTPGIVTPPLDGTWEGTFNFPFQREKILIRITTADNGIEATMDVPRQDAYDLSLHDIQVELPKVHFEWSEGSSLGVMDGELGSDGRIAGKVTQKGASGTFELIRQKAVSAAPQPPTPMPRDRGRKG